VLLHYILSACLTCAIAEGMLLIVPNAYWKKTAKVFHVIDSIVFECSFELIANSMTSFSILCYLGCQQFLCFIKDVYE